MIWGGSVLAVAFGWRFITSDWPHFIKLSACVVALFFAGYYVWRTDHVRLIPKLELVSLHMIYTPTNVPNLQRRFVQVLVRCATESPLDNCRGQLLRILKWSQGDWQPTLVDESLDLLWSNADIASVTLEPGNDKRLNVFFVDSATRNILPFAERMSMRLLLVSVPFDVFRFDVRVAAKDCLPKYVSVKATFGQNWDDVTIERIKE